MMEMNQAERQIFLDKCEKAFAQFQVDCPAFVFSEELARQIADVLKVEKLDPRNSRHLALAFAKVQSSHSALVTPETGQVLEEDELTVRARQLIAERNLTLYSIDQMSSQELERYASSAVWNRALELLNPEPNPVALLTRGELAQASSETFAHNRSRAANEPPMLIADAARKLAEEKRDFLSGFANGGSVPTPQRPRKTPVGLPWQPPKLSSEKDLQTAQRNCESRNKFTEDLQTRMSRRIRVLKHRGR
jgi:hypothetical protein